MKMTVDGCDIDYRITGEGENYAVILQGWGTSYDVYDIVASAIDDRYKVVQFDFPGFGRSDEPDKPWDVAMYADFFLKFMSKLGIDKATLVGHSYGGRVILKLASMKNTGFKMSKVVLIDSAGVLPVRTTKQKIRIKKYKIIKKIAGIKLIYALFPEVVDEWRSRQGSADYRNATPIMRQALVMAVNEDLSDALSDIKSETLLIWGDKDTATPLRDAHIMEERIPNAGLVVLEGAGHFSYAEQPEKFTGVLRSFL